MTIDAEALQENLEDLATAINELQERQAALVRVVVALAEKAGVDVPDDLVDDE